MKRQLGDEEWGDCYLIDIEVDGRKVQVFLDSDDGLTLRRCQKMSRLIETEIEEGNLLQADYILEVSSPGIDRPLVQKRQYFKNIGRKIEVVMKDETKLLGQLKAVEEEEVVLEVEGIKKKDPPTEHRIPFSNINKAIVQISFK